MTVWSQKASYRLIIGTYTNGKSKGIYLADFDNKTGKLKLTDSIETSNPSYLAVSDDEKYMYAVNELGATAGSGKITAFSLEAGQPAFKKINEQSTGGDDPCYITIDKTGKWVVAGNYTGGNFSVFHREIDGSIDASVQTINHYGKSIDPARQDKPHVHSTVFSPDNKFLLVADLGADNIISYHFDEATGAVKVAGKPTAIKPGGGPRHIVFHPNGKYVYVTEEMSGNVSMFEYNEGILSKKQTINALPESFKGKISTADIHVSSDGRFIYCSNRGESNTITIFSVGKNGLLIFVDRVSTLGKIPRNFSISPSGEYLLVANQDSDQVVVFKRNSKSGKLTDTGNRINVGNPVCLKWIK